MLEVYRTCRRCKTDMRLNSGTLRPVALDWKAPSNNIVYECRDLFACDVFANMKLVAYG